MAMNEPKFKNYQEVVIPNFLVNGDRMDIGGLIIDNDFRVNRGKYKVRINEVIFFLPEEKLVDATEFWRQKRKERDNV